jgi:hypothetical protein
MVEIVFFIEYYPSNPLSQVEANSKPKFLVIFQFSFQQAYNFILLNILAWLDHFPKRKELG